MGVSMGIHDGRTKELLKIQQNIQEIVAASHQVLHIDDFIFQGGKLNDQLNECFKKWKNFPTYRYVINMLCDFSSYSCSERDLEQLFREKENNLPLSETSEDILTYLSEYLIQRMEEIESDTLRSHLLASYSRDIIKKNLLDLQEDFFLELLAPILDLNLDEINLFMVRVFKRDQLCNYVPREYLLGLAAEINAEMKKGTTMEVLYELKKYYDSLKHVSVGEVVPDKEGTRYIAQKSRIDFKRLSGDRLSFKVKDYPEIMTLLEWYKALQKPSVRNRKQAYERLFDEAAKLYQPEMDDYLRVIKIEENKRTKMRHRESMSVPVTVWYDKTESGKAEWIKAGTRFIGKNCLYETKEDVELTQEDYVQICVHICPHPDNAKKDSPKSKTVPSGVVFHIVSGDFVINGKPVIKNVRTDSIKNIDPSKNSSKWTKPKWVKDQAGTGFVVMDILAGENLPESLCVEYQGFKFVPVPDAFGIVHNLRKTITVYVDIASVDMKNVKKGFTKIKEVKVPIYILDETESIRKMESNLETVVKISNRKNRVTVPQKMFNENFELIDHSVENAADIAEDSTGLSAWQLFFEYMYGIKDYEIASNLDIELTEKIGLDMKNIASDWLKDTMIMGDAEWFAALSEYRQRNVILILLFLLYIKKNDNVITNNKERFVRNFRSFVAANMEKMRYDELYLGYPVDCLIMFLLASCIPEDMCDTLRVLYKESILYSADCASV